MGFSPRYLSVALGLAALTAAAASGVLLSGAPKPGPTPEWSMASADDGARIVTTTHLSARLVDITVDSPALERQAMVRLLLPSDFETQPTATWPVLFLLHGADEPLEHRAWTELTDVEALTARCKLLVVMPEAGERGFYTDWWNGGTLGAPRWETFHLIEVRQLVERNFRAGTKRAIAGLSMGGFGAMSYAARHPDLFEAAASFSGVLDLSQEAGVSIIDPRTFGDPVGRADIWRAHDPSALAADLRGKVLFIWYGSGKPGDLDASGAQPDPLERRLAAGNEAFVARLRELAIPATVETGDGTHSWPYWQRALHAALPLLEAAVR